MTSAIVVGGGLAGVAAALRLADGGMSVTLLESRPRLGGAAFSFRRDGLSVDNGQHVFLRCCTAYRGFLDRIGATHLTRLQPRLDIPVLRSDGVTARLRRLPGLPAPGHLGVTLAGYRLLSPADRARAVRGALALRRLDPSDPALDRRTLGGFLREHGQNDATIAALWGIVATATLNLEPDQASLALAAKVFRTGLLDTADASDVGYAAVPLGDIHGTAAEAALTAAGVAVLTGSRVTRVEPDSVACDGALHHADAVVLAVPPHDAFAVSPQLRTTAAAPAAQLETTPIVNVHVVYDRTVTELPFAAAVDSPVQWFFDRTDSSGVTGLHRGAQYLAVTVSSAQGIIDEPAKQLAGRYVTELARLLPAAARAQVLDTFVTRERRATFRQAAGSAALRPRPEDADGAPWLAGSWTATGWPDTMESAVRSGLAAADGVLSAGSAVARRVTSVTSMPPAEREIA